MACLLIVDDDADNAGQLCSLLQADLPGCHDIVCIHGLADYRRLRRQHKPDLVLVELLRQHSNGFSLAAALARQRTAQVVLISDRDLGSDRAWASARGIAYVLSRRGGRQKVARQIESLLQTGCLATADEVIQPSQRQAMSKALLHELTTTPETALLNCLASELQHWSCPEQGNILCFPAAERGQLTWLKNLLLYISDIDTCHTLKLLIQHSDSPAGTTWLHVRENALLQLEPAAGATLRSLCVEQWLTLRQTIQSDIGELGERVSCCQQLLNALSLMPDAKALAGSMRVDVDVGDTAWVECVEKALFSVSADDELQTLIDTECMRILSCLESDGEVFNRTALGKLARLGLLLRAVARGLHWQPLLDECLRAMYSGQAVQTAMVRERLTYLTLSLLCKRVEWDAGGAPVNAACEHRLPVEVTRKLAHSISEISQLLATTVPLQHRMSCLMVSVYKLRSWLVLAAERHACDDKICLRWRLVVGCLYEMACHGALQADRLTQADMNDICKFVSELAHCSQQGIQPSENTLINLAALEITIASRSRYDEAEDHQLLAAGLHRLPKPDRIVSDMLKDTKQSGTVLGEITHELLLLTEGARRLGVRRVEGLARLLLDCYQQLAGQPELLQSKTSRLALGRAHRVLCRLLDQAAAWLPLDQTGSGLAVQAVIDDLFTQFDHSRHKTNAPVPAGGAVPDVASARAAWVHCQSLNRQLRQLLRRSGNLSEYRSLMSELLRQQQALIEPHLRYQSPD